MAEAVGGELRAARAETSIKLPSVPVELGAQSMRIVAEAFLADKWLHPIRSDLQRQRGGISRFRRWWVWLPSLEFRP
jgi:hypothetical protein